MLSIHLFRNEKERVLDGLRKKNFKETDLVDTIISTDEKRRQIQAESDGLAAEINAASKS